MRNSSSSAPNVKGYYGRGNPKFFSRTDASHYTDTRTSHHIEPDSYPVLHRSRYTYVNGQGYTPRYTGYGRGRCLQENLLAVLDKARKAVATGKHTLPVLHNVLLRQENDRLHIYTTNLEYAYHASIGFHATDSQIWDDIHITTDAKYLYDYVSELAPETISFLQHDGTLTLKCGNRTANLKTIEAAQFPAIPTNGKLVATITDTRKWLDSLKACASGASKEDNRPILTGVHLVAWNDNTARIEASDSYTLTVRRMKSIEVISVIHAGRSRCQ